MSLKLYFHPLASFCHKALIALYENRIPFEAIIVDLRDEASSGAFRAVWPMAKMPVLRDECDMNIGVRNRGPLRNFFHLQMKVGPVLSGIRVMKLKVWDTVPLRYQERFKIEAALNCFCSRSGFRQQHRF